MKSLVRKGLRFAFSSLAVTAGGTISAYGQAPTIEESGLLPSGTALMSKPGSMQSLLGPTPGAGGGGIGGMVPGRGDMILGRLGASGGRVPTAVTMPGGVYQGPPGGPVSVAPQPIPVPRAPFYGTLEVPKHEGEEGPPNGLTLDQAIELVVNRNLDLLAKKYEIPQARADVLTASLRANPIFYADSQLNPYGTFSRARPGGPNQYDVNMSHPLDYSGKRKARMTYAARALHVMEAQYQNEVRLAVGAACNAYLDVLAARETVHYAETSVQGLTEIVRINETLFNHKGVMSADVDQARADLGIARLGLDDAHQILQQRTLVLTELLGIPPAEADQLELRGAIKIQAPPLPPVENMIAQALESRADMIAYRLGVPAAEANLKLQQANRFADAYLLVQPYTFQNNVPFNRLSGTSWALGITVPVPFYNRNQGNIERARYNIDQSHVQLQGQARRVEIEVRRSYREYEASRLISERIKSMVLPGLEKALKDRLLLYQEGEANKLAYHDTQRRFNDQAKAYLDALVRHRRSMIDLNTVMGARVLP